MNSCASARSDSRSTASNRGVNTQIPEESQTSNHRQTKILIVFAAASLSDAFSELANEFEANQPGVKIYLSFAGSQVLRAQIEQGGEADVFTSADQKNMDLLVGEGLVDKQTERVIATNRLVVILPTRNPAGLASIKDLARPGMKIILADVSVPAGQYAQEVLAKLSSDANYGMDFSSNVLRNVVSYETDVRQVVTKVELGEADAGIAYASDAIASANLHTIPIPDQYNIIAQYPIAVPSNAPNPDLGEAFIDYVVSAAGRAILQKWGFSPGK